jgi:hypothetical protein
LDDSIPLFFLRIIGYHPFHRRAGNVLRLKRFYMISKYWIRSLILLLAISSAVFTQTPTTAAPQTDEQRKAQKELERKALNLLDDVLKDADSFKHAENRIRLRASVAFLLWNYDEARARILFRDATAGLSDLLKEQTVEDPVEAQKMLEGPRQLRSEMLLMLAQRDGRMARELLRATRSPNPNARGTTEDAELQMDMTLAMQVASSDPKLAAEIAGESLSKGLTYQLTSILSAIRAKDPEVAAQLAGDIMTKLRTEKLSSSGEARIVALSLLQIATETPETDAKSSLKDAPPLLEQSALRELAEMVTAEALRSPSQNSDMLSSLQSIMPAVEKYAPARAGQIRQKAPQTGTDVEETSNGINVVEAGKYQLLFEKGSVDELISAAPNAQPGMREALYQRAAAKMMEDGDAERARQLINEKVSDPAQRKEMLAQIDQLANAAAVEQGKVEQGRKLLATLRTNEERVMLLAQLASGAAAKGEKKIALQLLEEARGMIAQRAKNINQLGAQLVVARVYAQLDPARSLTILEPIVDQLNELLGAATVLGGFFVEELIRDDEIMLGPISQLFSLTSNDFLQQYVGDVNALARSDFERTRALIDRFQRDEIRTLMRLLLAQSILSPQLSPSTGKPTVISPMATTVKDN